MIAATESEGLGHGRRPRDAGMGMTELIVSMMVFAIVAVIVGSFFIQSGRITSSSLDNRRSSTDAGNVTAAIQGPLRFATRVAVSGGVSSAFQEAKADTMTVLASTDAPADATDPVATKYQFTVSNGTLTIKRCSMTVTSAGLYTPGSCNGPRSRTVGSGIQSTAVFTYNDASGSPIALSAGAVPAASLDSIASVTIAISVKSTGSKQPPVPITTTVLLPNIGLTSTT